VKRLVFIITVCFSYATFGIDNLVEFSNPLLRERYYELITELRCPKCQNQNLADSDSPISQDLKDEIHQLLERGLSDQEIEEHLTTRYSDFILYRPKVNSVTYFLWGSPIIILFIGAWMVRRFSLRSDELNQEDPKNEIEQQRLHDLLSSRNRE